MAGRGGGGDGGDAWVLGPLFPERTRSQRHGVSHCLPAVPCSQASLVVLWLFPAVSRFYICEYKKNLMIVFTWSEVARKTPDLLLCCNIKQPFSLRQQVLSRLLSRGSMSVAAASLEGAGSAECAVTSPSLGAAPAPRRCCSGSRLAVDHPPHPGAGTYPRGSCGKRTWGRRGTGFSLQGQAWSLGEAAVGSHPVKGGVRRMEQVSRREGPAVGAWSPARFCRACSAGPGVGPSQPPWT